MASRDDEGHARDRTQAGRWDDRERRGRAPTERQPGAPAAGWDPAGAHGEPGSPASGGYGGYGGEQHGEGRGLAERFGAPMQDELQPQHEWRSGTDSRAHGASHLQQGYGPQGGYAGGPSGAGGWGAPPGGHGAPAWRGAEVPPAPSHPAGFSRSGPAWRADEREPWAGPNGPFGRWTPSGGAAGYGQPDPRYEGYGASQGAAAGPQHHVHDPDYQQWREEQMRHLDREYQAFRQERYRRFSDEFNSWRSSRASAQAPDAGEPAPGNATREADGPADPSSSE